MPAARGQACNDGPDRRSGNGAHYSVLARGWQPLIARQCAKQVRDSALDRYYPGLQYYLSFKLFST
ncbi:hypothetical protein CLAM6_31500 [Cobetia sp. AM6]|nr:hypothetical protein CLAM6_31500 [Cobetia sp. AM6]